MYFTGSDLRPLQLMFAAFSQYEIHDEMHKHEQQDEDGKLNEIGRYAADAVQKCIEY